MDAFDGLLLEDERIGAKSRDPKALDKKHENTRSSYGMAPKECGGSGASTAEKEDAIIKWDGPFQYGRGAFSTTVPRPKSIQRMNP